MTLPTTNGQRRRPDRPLVGRSVSPSSSLTEVNHGGPSPRGRAHAQCRRCCGTDCQAPGSARFLSARVLWLFGYSFLVWQAGALRLLLVGPLPGWWWTALWLATRRGAVDRRTATMLYASQNRSYSIRRWLPQNLGVRDDIAIVGDIDGEGRVCCGGAPARRNRFADHGADHAVSEFRIIGLVVGVHLGPQETGALGRRRWPRPTSRSCGPPGQRIVGIAGSGPSRIGRRWRD
jgi:hypothetical protein